jgi:methionyl-tRNA formyltransferase
MKTVFFGYSHVGYGGLRTLLDLGVDVALVITHEDTPGEHIWFGSVAQLAHERGIPVITPPSPNTPDVIARIKAIAPQWIISLYYRHMIGPAILNIPPRGAMNVHGSLLPKYRGRAPVNWAIANGELQTGVTLHYMVEKADAGDVVGQIAVPIGADENAGSVMNKISIAAQDLLTQQVPLIAKGVHSTTPQDATHASYFGRRTPAHGTINTHMSAQAIHSGVRAVTPYPQYPGGFCTLEGKRYRILQSWLDKPAGEESTAFICGEGGREVIYLKLEAL